MTRIRVLVLLIIGLIATAPIGAMAETPLQRGAYLMQSIVACGNCHTPQGPNGPIAGMELAGGLKLDMGPPFTAYGSNITPDKETGIGAWTDEQIIAAIRDGKRPDGSIIGPPMPIALYRGISDSDAKAIVAYLRSLKPVRNEVPRSVYRIPLPPNYGPPVKHVADVARSDKLAYGAYLAGPLGHCIECHSTPNKSGVPDFEHNLGAGGMEFPGPWGVSVAPNITPTGLAQYTDAQVKAIIAKGVRPDGSKMLPPMAYPYYAKIRPADMNMIVAYLRSLPPK